MNNFATNHAIFFFIILSLLLVHNHDFISSSASKPIKSTPTDSSSSCNSPTNIAIPLFLAFLSGALFTLLCILTILKSPTFFTTPVQSYLRRIKPLRQSPPPPPPTVNHQSSTTSSSGISTSQLQSLPIFVYSAENRPKLGKGSGECAICLTEFLNEQTLRWLPGCDHLFHRKCIDAWFESRKTCPCCRSNVERVGSEILPLENGSNLLEHESDDGRRVGCERSVVSGLIRVLMGRRRHHIHRPRRR